VTVGPLARVQRWYLRAGLFLLPLAFWWDTYDHYIIPKLLVARVLVIGLLVLFVARAASAHALAIKRTPLDLPLLAFLASAIASTLFAENQNVALFGTYGRYDGLITIATYAALFWLSIQAIESPGEARTVLRVLLVSGYAVAWIAIAQSVTDSLRQGALAPAFGTLGQKNVLGAFAAMLLPLAYYELVEADSWSARVLALNALVVIGTALLLTFSRSAWLGASVAGVVLVAGQQSALRRLLTVAAMGAVGVIAVAFASLTTSLPLERTDLSAFGDRPAVWGDTFQLVASRPLLGYGPDNFGLVFPRFQSAELQQQWDKAHSEILQVTATQGLVGTAAYLFLLAAFIRAFWRGRARPGAFAVFAAWTAYQVTLQLNFSALASAFPFWVFAAAAIESWGAPVPARPRRLEGAAWAAAGGAVIVGLAGVAAVSTVPLYLADAQLLAAVNHDYGGRPELARPEAEQARQLWPVESVYAVEVGNVAFERGDWVAARNAYGDAARLGTYNPLVYRNLALADRNLGLKSEGESAARKAVELDRFDPANRALLAEFEVAGP
jgi:O-antigen ligase